MDLERVIRDTRTAAGFEDAFFVVQLAGPELDRRPRPRLWLLCIVGLAWTLHTCPAAHTRSGIGRGPIPAVILD
ncbi:hypothetical protein PGT21_024257 [Puccinia graminis f. sp. tritici]|uniref:Uncharacterized protein n=1 Tax=Puccinia graminis f. sp. tritici TaxID=56615 RepID=A0A5B0QBN4_PUCGR|nr:hypothetical protein PGT21_024257 [Puccinia graminis f. sp. tritici]